VPQWDACRGETITQNPGSFVFVIDVFACGPNLAGERAQAITSEMAARANG
jgi:hypothetical protein